MPWLQLVRWKNLLIILFTQLLAWWCVILPGSPAVLTFVNLICLTLSTVLIAAAGYIINDYFDIKIDNINRPQKVVLEVAIPRRQAILMHAALNTVAMFLAAFVAAQARHYEWLLLQVTCSLLLWFYSTHFKRQYITGNVVVALLTALTIVVLVVYEPAMQQLSKMVLLVYAYFAFMLTWMREIVKDMEDHIGDSAEGCVTMPIRKGLRYAAWFCIALSASAILPLICASIALFGLRYNVLSVYIAVALIAPMLVWNIVLLQKTTSQHYHAASRALKAIMLLGVCSLLIYHFQLHSDYAR